MICATPVSGGTGYLEAYLDAARRPAADARPRRAARRRRRLAARHHRRPRQRQRAARNWATSPPVVTPDKMINARDEAASAARHRPGRAGQDLRGRHRAPSRGRARQRRQAGAHHRQARARTPASLATREDVGRRPGQPGLCAGVVNAGRIQVFSPDGKFHRVITARPVQPRRLHRRPRRHDLLSPTPAPAAWCKLHAGGRAGRPVHRGGDDPARSSSSRWTWRWTRRA